MAAFTMTAVERFIRTGVPDGKPHASFRDGSGLCLRLLPSGAASWQFIYRPRGVGRSGAQRTVTLGSWPAIDVRRAGEEAKRLAGEVAARRDPRADIIEAKRRERALVSAALRLREMDRGAPPAEGGHDDVVASAGPRPSLTARPQGA